MELWDRVIICITHVLVFAPGLINGGKITGVLRHRHSCSKFPKTYSSRNYDTHYYGKHVSSSSVSTSTLFRQFSNKPVHGSECCIHLHLPVPQPVLQPQLMSWVQTLGTGWIVESTGSLTLSSNFQPCSVNSGCDGYDYFYIQRRLVDFFKIDNGQIAGSGVEAGRLRGAGRLLVGGDIGAPPRISQEYRFHSEPFNKIPRFDSLSPNSFHVGGLPVIQDVPSSPYTYTHAAHNTSISRNTDMTKRGHSKKRDAKVELVLIVDNSIYRKYLRSNRYRADIAKRKMLQYYKILFALVNQRFHTISGTSFTISTHLCKVLIAETRREAAWLEYLAKWSEARQKGVVGASRALRRFQRWVRGNEDLQRFDHAVVVTDYILSKKKQEVDGLAYVGTACRTKAGKSVSIVHDDGDFQAAGIIAHELGHSLGATHDGEKANRACPASGNYVMSPHSSYNNGTPLNVYYFSPCSVKQMKQLILSSQGRCLHNTPTSELSYDLKADPPGETFDEDIQCKLAFGDGSRFCDKMPGRSTMCQRLWCTNVDDGGKSCITNTRLMALPGTKCGYYKHCQLGECVNMELPGIASHLPGVVYHRYLFRAAKCPVGDGNPAYCSVIIRASPYLCSRPRLKQYCCESCHNTEVQRIWT